MTRRGVFYIAPDRLWSHLPTWARLIENDETSVESHFLTPHDMYVSYCGIRIQPGQVWYIDLNMRAEALVLCEACKSEFITIHPGGNG